MKWIQAEDAKKIQELEKNYKEVKEKLEKEKKRRVELEEQQVGLAQGCLEFSRSKSFPIP